MVEIKNITATQLLTQLQPMADITLAVAPNIDIEVAEEEDMLVDSKAPTIEEKEFTTTLSENNTKLIDNSNSDFTIIPDDIVLEVLPEQMIITNSSSITDKNVDAESGEEEENIEDSQKAEDYDETPEAESEQIVEEMQQQTTPLRQMPKKRKKINPLVLGAGIFIAIKLLKK